MDEGTWDGALSSEDLDGLEVSRSNEIVAHQRGSCQDLDGYEVIFAGDSSVTLTPFSTDSIRVGGEDLTATAVRATEYGNGGTCSVSDTTGFLTWAVTR